MRILMILGFFKVEPSGIDLFFHARYCIAIVKEGVKVRSEEESSMRILVMMYLWSDPTQQVF